jgi:lysophospholipase L1-like esterase
MRAALVATCLALIAAPAPASDGGFSVVAFGTSLTSRGGWQPSLEATLRRCLDKPVTVASVARAGAGTDWALDRVAAVLAERPDVVLIEFAANDAALHRMTSPGQSRTNLDRIVTELLAAQRPPRLFVMAMNPMRGPRAWIRPLLDRYTDIHRDVAARRGVGFIDHRPDWERLGPTGLAAAIPDGVHPLAEAAARIVTPNVARHIVGSACHS